MLLYPKIHILLLELPSWQGKETPRYLLRHVRYDLRVIT